ncbi:7167_t:CDS:2 [Paraglomus occultum]|uniref:Fucosyltransferase n=1 Tax=Paraglomus occultum TaxID=144539 RepID=A0A9N9AGL4_9GLOM|nr:7167_t:CDS:2 [Paraglomus occultum]
MCNRFNIRGIKLVHCCGEHGSQTVYWHIKPISYDGSDNDTTESFKHFNPFASEYSPSTCASLPPTSRFATFEARGPPKRELNIFHWRYVTYSTRVDKNWWYNISTELCPYLSELNIYTKFAATIYPGISEWPLAMLRVNFGVAPSHTIGVIAGMDNVITFIPLIPSGEILDKYGADDGYGYKNMYDIKREVLAPYKFVLAFENSNCAGYVTEKVYDALLVDAIPIKYMGAADISFWHCD